MATLRKVDSIDLADYVLATVGPVSHLKLQKLVYYVEAWHLAFFGKSLIDDEFEAWLHGPVSRKVWNEYRDVSKLYDALPISGQRAREVKKTIVRSVSDDQLQLITDVLEEYGDKSSYHLECLTHRERPWVDARKGVEPGASSSNKISKRMMQKFYEERLG